MIHILEEILKLDSNCRKPRAYFLLLPKLGHLLHSSEMLAFVWPSPCPNILPCTTWCPFQTWVIDLPIQCCCFIEVDCHSSQIFIYFCILFQELLSSFFLVSWMFLYILLPNYESFIYIVLCLILDKWDHFGAFLFWLFWCNIVRLGHMVCGNVHSFSLIGRIPLYKYLTIYLSYSCWICG